MARNLSTTLSDLDSAITAEHVNAWAAFAGYAENAHLAAIAVVQRQPGKGSRGPTFYEQLRDSDFWPIQPLHIN